MKRILVVLGLSLLFTGLTYKAEAQSYKNGLGVRFSPFYGFTFKHFMNRTDAVEGILHSRWGAFKITGLWERHTPAFSEPGLFFFYGGGAHIGGISGDRYYRGWPDDRRRGTLLLGLDGILGLEYTIQDSNVPLNFGIDWKPTLNFAPYSTFWGDEFAISVRYTFGR